METGLYYLQSRYYNPEWGRFINGDGLVATGQGLLGNNMFAYCGNNPVKRSDSSGKSWGVALQFLDKWLWGDGSYEIYDWRSGIVGLLSSNNKIHSLVYKAYKETNSSQNHIEGTGEFTFKEDGPGLYLSTQHFNYYIYDVKKEVRVVNYIFFKKTQVRYTAKVIVYDYYNFDSVREWNSFGNIMNNIAYYMHQYGAGKDYMWYAAYIHATPWEWAS